jgi:hypothetical protein
MLVPGCATTYDRKEAVQVIMIAQPENPSGQIQPGTSPDTHLPGLTGALVKGFEEGRAQMDREKAGDVVPATGPFLSDQKIELGTTLATEAAEDLKAEGYTVVGDQASNTVASDAVLSFEFLQVNYMRTLGPWHPQLQVKATLTRTRDKSVLFQRTYFCSSLVHSMWDEAIDADAKYDAETGEMFRDNSKLLIEAYNAGVAKIAQHVAAALAKHEQGKPLTKSASNR